MKFRKAFCPNPAVRFDASILREMADEVIYVCDTPIFDDLASDEMKPRFEGRVKEVMRDFDWRYDLIVFFGDALIYAMMLFVVCQDEDNVEISVARFSTKANEYVVRKLKLDELW